MNRVIVGVVLAGCIVACGPQRLANSQPTAESLATEVLLAIAQRNEPRLRALSLSEEEFERRVWPGLPAARPERNLPWSYVWMDLQQKSDAMLTRTLKEHGGRLYMLEAVRFEGESTDHGDYRVRRETVLTVREGGSSPMDLRIIGSVIEADGGWKVFSYLADP